MKLFTPEEKIAQARLSLAVEYPFFGSIFFRLRVHEDDSCPTAWTDGSEIGYNTQWLGQWEIPQILGVFIHEILHIVLKHHLREELSPRMKKQHGKFNRAADYALNPAVLKTPGADLPPGCLVDLDRWADSLAEDIFNQLPDDDSADKRYGGKGQPSNTGKGVSPGEVRPFKKGKGNPAEKAIENAKVDQWVQAAGMKAQGVGKLGEGTKRLIKKITTPEVDWRDELQLMAESMCKDDYTWTRPNVRYLQQGMYLPSMHGQTMPDLLFYVDTSGSLKDDMLAQIMAEVRNIIDSFHVRVIVVYWNTKYQFHEEFLPADILDPSWSLAGKGGGGTRFNKAWDWMHEQVDIDPKGIVFFTDYESTQWPMEDPGVPVIWAQVADRTYGHTRAYDSYMPEYGSRVKIPKVGAS